jgi:hypothetical protein
VRKVLLDTGVNRRRSGFRGANDLDTITVLNELEAGIIFIIARGQLEPLLGPWGPDVRK